MPEEVFIISIAGMAMTTGLMIFLTRTVVSYLKWRKKGPGPSLTASELKGLMREAVEEANVDLERRLAALEERSEATERRLLAERSEHLVDAADLAVPMREKQPAKSA